MGVLAIVWMHGFRRFPHETAYNLQDIDIENIVRAIVQQELRTSGGETSRDVPDCNSEDLTDIITDRSYLERIVRKEMQIFGWSDVNMADWALASAGGTVVAHSEGYTSSRLEWLLNRVPVFRLLSNWEKKASNIISPRTEIGGDSNNYVIIKVAAPVYPQSFSVSHVPKHLSPTPGTAPRRIRVWGSECEESAPVFLSEFEYSIEKGAVQTFDEIENPNPYSYFKFEILNNWGNEDVTCLYQVMIHGSRRVCNPIPDIVL